MANDDLLRKVKKLLALAADASDEESRSALARAQALMTEHAISEADIFDHRKQNLSEEVIQTAVYDGRPRRWMYRLAWIIAKNFRVEDFYITNESTQLIFMGLQSDVQLAEITFQYATGSIGYSARKYMQRPEIKRKRKWQMKQDYIEGYLSALESLFDQQVVTNGYELALQLPDVVKDEIAKIEFVTGKDVSHEVKDFEAYHTGYREGKKFKQRDQIN
ncbi:DUF2786 domain-containing protein [Listeria monocytogenes]|nr:DUF2786 domain-containing protein [Listeria monocytogenes]EAE4671790.1 DUF2786 domain-containing protein [Listeria monocytogenes]EAG7217828.1 DUF2786 domain-containing protein [Listeria monocytogenes]EAG7850006.1 DUF2786 domain-containing protein [Listeria monocytogenes]EAH2085918.1 DUF2786 domain-containing protein [Listeria monocytogenes]